MSKTGGGLCVEMDMGVVFEAGFISLALKRGADRGIY